ncbi:MAG: hypothetical protein AAFQ94_28295 [Bacteroidota bacterium]
MIKYLLTALLITTVLIANAQSIDDSEKGSVSVVVNPSFFVLGGYHFKPSYHFPKRWSVGATLQGGFELPDFARDQFFNTSAGEVIVDWTYAIGLELKYRFSDAPYDKGFFTAFNLGYEGWDVSSGQEIDQFENWFASLDAGYNWYFLKDDRLNLGVHYTLIFILNNTDNRTVDEVTYNIRSVVPPSVLPSILVGWRF